MLIHDDSLVSCSLKKIYKTKSRKIQDELCIHNKYIQIKNNIIHNEYK